MANKFEGFVFLGFYRELQTLEKDKALSQFSNEEWATEYPEKQTRMNSLPELIREALEAIPDNIMRVTYQGESKANDWHADRWAIDLQYGNTEIASIEYRTGAGLRKLSKIGEIEIKRIQRCDYMGVQRKRMEIEEVKTRHTKPVKPSKASILYSLLLDADCGALSFYDFCSEYGYDNDSIKAQEIHRACMQTREHLKQWASPEALEAFRVATQDM